jgi:prepilin-type N-terminal cleavage/methylation domain-containing protein
MNNYQIKPQLQKILLQKYKLDLSSRNNEGFTILECLMAILIVTIILSFISPLIFLTIATRVQNRRVEQAMAIAQSEIDRVQVVMAKGLAKTDEAANLPPVEDKDNSEATLSKIYQIAAPNSIMSGDPKKITEIAYPANTRQVKKIDINDDGRTDFLVQVFRDEGQRFNTGVFYDQLAVFKMGVRVYASPAEPNVTAGTLRTEVADVKFVTGLGQQATNPLIVLYTEVGRSDVDLSLDTYRAYINKPITP